MKNEQIKLDIKNQIIKLRDKLQNDSSYSKKFDYRYLNLDQAKDQI